MPAIHSVSTNAELVAALKTAEQGDVISLASGNYGELTLKGQAGFDMNFAGGVAIVSADPTDPAVLSGLDLRGASNLTFSGIKFDYTFADGDRAWTRPFDINDSHNITITNSEFDGDVASGISDAEDGFGVGFGLSIRDSSGISVEDSTFTSFTGGIVTKDSQDISISGNELWDMRSDGLNFAGVQRVKISNNYIHDFRTSAEASDHADFIQFWTRGTTEASTDITIAGNILDIGNGSMTQSIFMRNDQVDRGLAGEELFYRNVQITDNVIVNAHSHGITVGETDGLIISNNTVTHADGANQDGLDATVEIPRILVSLQALNVVISQNITGGLVGPDGQESWIVSENAIVQDQDPSGTNYYSDVFLASSLSNADGSHLFQVNPDSAVALTGAGASSSYGDYTGVVHTTPVAQFQISSEPTNAAARIFDAGTSTSGDGMTYHWAFGDGETAVGAVVSHTYMGGGLYQATLTVTNADGLSTAATSTIGVAGPQVLAMQVDGAFTAFDFGEATLLDATGQGALGGLDLGAAGVTATVDRSHLSDVLNTDSFEIAFTLQADTVGASGEVFRLHSSFLTQIDAAGEMQLYAWSKDGEKISLKTSGADLNSGASHNVSVRLIDGALSLIVDGVAVSTPMTSELADLGRHDLSFGNPWGKTNFDGTITAFSVTVSAEDYVAPIVDNFDFIAAAGDTPPIDDMAGLDNIGGVLSASSDSGAWDVDGLLVAMDLYVDDFGF